MTETIQNYNEQRDGATAVVVNALIRVGIIPMRLTGSFNQQKELQEFVREHLSEEHNVDYSSTAVGKKLFTPHNQTLLENGQGILKVILDQKTQTNLYVMPGSNLPLVYMASKTQRFITGNLRDPDSEQ